MDTLIASEKISIIMPAYNAGRYIQEAIQSVLDQSYPNWELLIIDDESDDDTEAIVTAIKDSRIHYQKIARRGSPSAVRNVGIQKATGNYIAFLDADDLFEQNTLTIFLTHMQRNPNCLAVYGVFRKMDQDGVFMDNPCTFLEEKEEGDYQFKPNYEHTWENILTCQTIHEMCFMARAEVFNTVGYFNEDIAIGEDVSFYIRMFLHDFDAVQAVPSYVYRYRVYSASICNDAARFDRILSNLKLLFNYLFLQLTLPKNALQYRSQFIGKTYGYYAKTRSKHQHLKQVIICLKAAWQHPNLQKKDWVQYCAPILLYYPCYLLYKKLLGLKSLLNFRSIQYERLLLLKNVIASFKHLYKSITKQLLSKVFIGVQLADCITLLQLVTFFKKIQ